LPSASSFELAISQASPNNLKQKENFPNFLIIANKLANSFLYLTSSYGLQVKAST
jgi:hypothetical protein